MIPSDLTNKKVKQETDLQSNSRCTGPKRHLFSYQKLYLNGPTYDGPTYDGLTYEDQAKCFSSQSLLGLPRLLNKYVTN